MADKKISALTALAQGDVVVSTDVLPIVDTSATETKKIAVNALVGAAAAAGLTNVDINSGTIDGTTIATSDITVGSGKTLNVSAGTLTLADNQISGDKVEGGTINAITINTLTSTAVNATTVDATNVEVTNIKAKDGTAAATIADSTGSITFEQSPVIFETSNTERGRIVTSGGNFDFLAGSTTTPTISLASNVATFTNNPILSGGTANGVLYLNGSKVATSGSALVFDGTNLGIGTSSPAYQLDLQGGTTNNTRVRLLRGTDDVNQFMTLGWDRIQVHRASVPLSSPQTSLSFDQVGSDGTRTAMFIDSSGNLGIGTTSPLYRLDVRGAGAVIGVADTGTAGATLFGQVNSGSNGVGAIQFFNGGDMGFDTGATGAAQSTKMRLTASGNLGLGVTPYANTLGKSLDLVNNGGLFSYNNNVYLTSNAYFDGAWAYKTTNYASMYSFGASGTHSWFTAPSGTINTAISFTQAMTLDASGNLLVKNTVTDPRNLTSGTGYKLGDSFEFANSSTVNVINRTASGSGDFVGFRVQSSGIGSLATDGTNVSLNAFSNLIFGTNSTTERARIDASGNVGIGTSSPANRLEVASGTGYQDIAKFRTADSTAANNSGGGFSGVSSATAGSREAILWLDADGANFAGGDYFFIQKFGNSGIVKLIQQSNAAMIFEIANTERARITSGGYFKASNNGTYNNSTGTYHEFIQTADDYGLLIRPSNANYTYAALSIQVDRNTTNNSFYAIDYYNIGAAASKFKVADSGNVTNTNGSYGTISDAKMKTDIVDAGSQWDDIKAVRFRKFKMKDDPSGLMQLGVVAQELEQTSPGLVDELPDHDVEGNDLGTTTKSVKTSVLLMKAAVALQEAMARIEKLEAEMAALKGA